MTSAALDIEQIVREVMRRLQSGSGQTHPKSSISGDVSHNGTSRQISNSELVLEVPVVSLAELESRLEQRDGETYAPSRLAYGTVNSESVARRLQGVKQVTIRHGTIVTPAVRDLLGEQKVTLRITDVRDASKNQLDSHGDVVPLAMSVVSRRFDASDLFGYLSQHLHVNQLNRTDLVNAVNELARKVCTGDCLGLLLTEQSAPAICLANRLQSVRAVEAHDTQTTCAAAESVGANLLVVNPLRTDRSELKRMAETFCLRGVQPCPQAYKKQLE